MYFLAVFLRVFVFFSKFKFALGPARKATVAALKYGPGIWVRSQFFDLLGSPGRGCSAFVSLEQTAESQHSLCSCAVSGLGFFNSMPGRTFRSF